MSSLRKRHKRRDWPNQKRRKLYGKGSLYSSTRKRDAMLGYPMYFDRQGRAVSLKRWGTLFDRHDMKAMMRYKRVAATTTKGGHWVSTVWLGLDLNIRWPGVPYRKLIFETMVFCHHDNLAERRGEWRKEFTDESMEVFVGRKTVAEANIPEIPRGCDLDDIQDRYSTWAQALKGHHRMVEWVRQHERNVSMAAELIQQEVGK
jgi:hypothetical protein